MPHSPGIVNTYVAEFRSLALVCVRDPEHVKLHVARGVDFILSPLKPQC